MKAKSTFSRQAARLWLWLITLFLLPLNPSHPLGEAELFTRWLKIFIIAIPRSLKIVNVFCWMLHSLLLPLLLDTKAPCVTVTFLWLLLFCKSQPVFYRYLRLSNHWTLYKIQGTQVSLSTSSSLKASFCPQVKTVFFWKLRTPNWADFKSNRQYSVASSYAGTPSLHGDFWVRVFWMRKKQQHRLLAADLSTQPL